MHPRYSVSIPSTSSSSSSYFTILVSFLTGIILTIIFVSLGYAPMLPNESYSTKQILSIDNTKYVNENLPFSRQSRTESISSFIKIQKENNPESLTNERKTLSSTLRGNDNIDNNNNNIHYDIIPLADDYSIPDTSVVSTATTDTATDTSTLSSSIVSDKDKDTIHINTNTKSSPKLYNSMNKKEDDDDNGKDDDDDDNTCECPSTTPCSTTTISEATISTAVSTTTNTNTLAWQITDTELEAKLIKSSFSYPVGYDPSSSLSLPSIASSVSMEIHIPGWIFTNPYISGPLLHTGTSDNFMQYRKSQGEEDIFAITQFFWKKEGGIILESGAWDGIGFSTSYLFYHAFGWKSIHIEPGPANYQMLIKNRPDALNINTALCEHYQIVHWVEHHDLNTEEKAHLGAINGIAEFMAPKFRDQFWPGLDLNDLSALPTITCRPLTPLLLHYGLPHIDFWVLDVEGAELQVLKALNFSIITIDVIVIEADGFALEKDNDIIKYLTEHGYRHMGHHARNNWFVRDGFIPSKRP